MPTRPPLIAVCGASRPRHSDLTAAHEVGRLVAARGWTLICGGLGGVMAAAAQGANEAGGLVIGILPGEDPEAADPACTMAIATGLGEGRNLILVRAAAGVIAIGGGLGTLSEIALALRLGRPTAGLGTWKLTGPDGEGDRQLGLHRCPDAQAAVAWLAGRVPPLG